MDNKIFTIYNLIPSHVLFLLPFPPLLSPATQVNYLYMVLHGLNGLSITDLFANNAFCDYIYDKIPAVKFQSLIRKPKGWIKLAEHMNTLSWK